MLNMLGVAVEWGDGCGSFWTSLTAWLIQIVMFLVSGLIKVIGVFADLMNVAFYIFAGVDVNTTVGGSSNMYDIEVGGEKQNILDYFVFSKPMQKAYLYLAIIGLILVVIFTIYKIIRQDYFEKAGPRSKGPIFRNVAISCISFLLVIPIFYLIINVSSLLGIAVMDAMGMDASQFAGAKIFCLSWSDSGELVQFVNESLRSADKQPGSSSFKWMYNLHNQTLFTTLVDGKYVAYDAEILQALGMSTGWKGQLGSAALLTTKGKVSSPTGTTFHWFIYIVGVVVAIKSLFTLLLAMLQRIFKLMALFLVAPSPISQYVLDDGVKFKNWLSSSIHEGLRLVVATMSFSIYLMVLNLVGEIDFISAFNSALSASEGQALNNSVNVTTTLLVDGGAENSNWVEDAVHWVGDTASDAAKATASSVSYAFNSLVNSFMRIFVLIGAGGAILDIDQTITPLITGQKSSLDSGETGKAATAVASAAMGMVASPIGAAVGAAKAEKDNKGADDAARDKGISEEKEDAEQLEKSFEAGDKDGPGGSGDTSSPTEGGVSGGVDKDVTKPGGGGNGDGDKDDIKSSSESTEGKEKSESDKKEDDSKEDKSKNEKSDDKSKDGESKDKKGKGEKQNAKSPKSKKQTSMKNRTKSKNNFWGRAGIRMKTRGRMLQAFGKSFGKSLLNTAFKTAMTGVFGEKNVKEFLGARDKAEKEQTAAIKERAGNIKEKSYAKARQERIEELAQQVDDEKANNVTAAAQDVQDKSADCKKAANDKGVAEGALVVAGQEAEEANEKAQAENADTENAGNAKTQQDIINSTQKQIDGIRSKYGDDDAIQAKIAVLQGLAEKKSITPAQSAELKEYHAAQNKLAKLREKQSGAEGKLATYTKAQSERTKLVDLLSNKGGKYSGKTFDDFKQSVEANGTEEEKRLLGIGVEGESDEVKNARDKVCNEIFSNGSTEAARTANANLAEKQNVYAEASQRYETTKSALSSSTKTLEKYSNEYNKSSSLLDSLSKEHRYSDSGKTTINDKGEIVVSPATRSTSRKIRKIGKKSDKLVKGMQTDINNVKSTASTAMQAATQDAPSVEEALSNEERMIQNNFMATIGNNMITQNGANYDALMNVDDAVKGDSHAYIKAIKANIGSIPHGKDPATRAIYDGMINGAVIASRDRCKLDLTKGLDGILSADQISSIRACRSASDMRTVIASAGLTGEKQSQALAAIGQYETDIKSSKYLAQEVRLGNDRLNGIDSQATIYERYTSGGKTDVVGMMTEYRDKYEPNGSVAGDLQKLATYQKQKAVVRSFATMDDSYAHRGAEINTEYRAEAMRGRRMHEIIASGGDNITAKDKALITSITGQEIKAGASAADIVKYATTARDMTMSRQAILLNEAGELTAQRDNSRAAVNATLEAISKGLGAKYVPVEKPGNATGGATNNNVQNVTNVVNNNVISGTGTPFDSVLPNHSNNTYSASSDLERNQRLEASYERMQAEALSRLESCMNRLNVDVGAVSKKVDSIDNKIDGE